MNLYATFEVYSQNGVGDGKLSIVSSIEALENLLAPLLRNDVTRKDIRDILGGAASLHPLSDREALLSLKSEEGL